MFFNSGKSQASRTRKRDRSSRSGIVYLLKELDFDGRPTGMYKIGKSTRTAAHRIDEYQTGNPRKLEVVLEVKTEDCSALEAQLKQRFSANRRGEGGKEFFYFPDARIPMKAMIESDGRELPAFTLRTPFKPIVVRGHRTQPVTRQSRRVKLKHDRFEWLVELGAYAICCLLFGVILRWLLFIIGW